MDRYKVDLLMISEKKNRFFISRRPIFYETLFKTIQIAKDELQFYTTEKMLLLI